MCDRCPTRPACRRLTCVVALSTAIAVLLASTPAPAAVPPPKLDYRITTLPNGLTVVLLEDHSTPIAHVQIWYHVGSKDERAGRTGRRYAQCGWASGPAPAASPVFGQIAP